MLAKHVLKELYAKTVAFGRMFFGSLFMLLFLAVTNQLGEIGKLNFEQLAWVIITSTLLFTYVFFYYTGLKYVRVSVAAALLALAQPITAILSIVFSNTTVSAMEAIGFALIIIGLVTIVGIGHFFSLGKATVKIFLAKQK
ncbi:MAG: EamA family transporter [Candidatus Diapherotrites archaeon]|nr:EamA family transporter [Candidatus Diapherotrites archaeon]